MADLNALADRIETLKAGNAQANLTIWKAAFPDKYRQWELYASAMGNRDASKEENAERLKASGKRAAPDFTRSLDAAMKLIPDGMILRRYWATKNVPHCCEVSTGPDSGGFIAECDGSFPIALVAAALRARAGSATPANLPQSDEASK